MKKIIFLLIVGFTLLTSCSSSNEQDINKKDLTNYNLNIAVSCAEKTMQATEQIDYINNSDVIFREIKFHLYPNAFKSKDGELSVVSEYNFDKAYPNGFVVDI